MADKYKIGASLVVDGEKEYKAALAEVNKSMSVLASEAKKTAAAYADDKDSLEALRVQTEDYQNQAEKQREKVEILTKAYENSKEQLGENAAATKDWLIKLNNAEAALMKTENAIENNNQKIKEQKAVINQVKAKYDEWKDKIEDIKNAHPGMTKALETAHSAAKKLGSAGLTAIKGGAVAAVAGFTATTAAGISLVNKLNEISEETKELRDNLGKLETGFTTNGHTAETATKTYKDLYSILGDSDKATEAASHLALLTKNQEQLSSWTNIATGVYAQFGDSLPIESLTEAANETAKTGSLTGALADALNWVGVSEEKFQAKLDKCNSEQERSALITKTLNGLYDEQAEKYREVNSVLIDAQKAQATYELSLASLGESVDSTKNKLTANFLPGVSTVLDGLAKMLSGEEGASELIKNGAMDVVNSFEEMLPEVEKLLNGIGETFVEVAPELVLTMSNAIIDNADTMSDSSMQLLSKLAEGLLTEENMQKISGTTVTLVSDVVGFMGDNADMMMDGAATLILSFVDSLLMPENSNKLVDGTLDVVTAFVGGLISNAPEMAVGALELIGALLQAIFDYDWGGVAKDIYAGIKDGFKNIFSDESDGSHAGGIDYVPYDGYRAMMHKGEQLLTASEAVVYKQEKADNFSDYAELNRKVDALIAAQSQPANWTMTANGSLGALVRVINPAIERENKRSSAFA